MPCQAAQDVFNHTESPPFLPSGDGNGNFVDDNTLSVYMRRLRGKVEQDPSRPEHLLTIRGFGYQWKEAGE